MFTLVCYVVLFKGLVRDSPLGVCCAGALFVWFVYFVTYVGVFVRVF